ADLVLAHARLLQHGQRPGLPLRPPERRERRAQGEADEPVVPDPLRLEERHLAADAEVAVDGENQGSPPDEGGGELLDELHAAGSTRSAIRLTSKGVARKPAARGVPPASPPPPAGGPCRSVSSGHTGPLRHTPVRGSG